MGPSDIDEYSMVLVPIINVYAMVLVPIIDTSVGNLLCTCKASLTPVN